MKSLASLTAVAVFGSLSTAAAAVADQQATPGPKSYSVTATVNHSEPIVGHHVKIKGTVTPAAPGATVKLQLRYTGQDKWKNVDTATLTLASKFKFKEKATTVRERTYRVVKSASSHRAAGHSPGVTVTVYQWRDLTSLTPATQDGMGEVDSTSIHGITYQHSLVAYEEYQQPTAEPASIEYNLCTTARCPSTQRLVGVSLHSKAFRATVGLADSSPYSSSAQVTILTDGTQRYEGTFGLTESAAVAFDLTGVFRITITAVPTADGIAAIGHPQVLCNY
jgi:hypothetical protein